MSKLIMFFGWVWLITVIAGGFLQGQVPIASTTLTVAIDSTSTAAIAVVSTEGFSRPGIIVIGSEERVSYSSVTAVAFDGNVARPILRGTSGTTAVAHAAGETVRMIESSLINNSIDYDMAVIADSAGAQAFLAVPIAIFDMILSFGVSPFKFLGTDLQIITAIWGIAFVGLVVSFAVTLAGWRRV